MKIKHTKVLKDGRIHVLLELGATEAFPVPALHEDAFYKLNYPMDDTIIAGHILKDPQRIMWDSYSQKWMDV
jgi:hypothetical protein